MKKIPGPIACLPVVLALLLIPQFAFASHGVEALGALFKLLIGGAVFILINLIISLINLRAKRTSLRVINILMTLPLVVVGLALLSTSAQGGIVILTFLVMQGIIIYRSYDSGTIG